MREPTDRHAGRAEQPDPTVMGNELPRLRRLSELDDFEVADGDPDIRGWEVKDAAGQKLGTVHDLIAEMDTREVRYIDTAIDGSANDGEHHVLLPIGSANLNDDRNVVTIGALTRQQILALPRDNHAPLTRDIECDLVGRLEGTNRAADTGAEFYKRPEFRTEGFWGGRGPQRTRVTYLIAGGRQRSSSAD